MRADAGDLPRGSAHRAQANLYDSCRLPRLEVIDVLHASNSGGRCRRGGQPTAARNAAKCTPETCATLEIFTKANSRSCRRGLRQRAAGCARWRVYAEAVRRGCEHRAGASCLRVAGGLRRTRLASGCAVVLSRCGAARTDCAGSQWALPRALGHQRTEGTAGEAEGAGRPAYLIVAVRVRRVLEKLLWPAQPARVPTTYRRGRAGGRAG